MRHTSNPRHSTDVWRATTPIRALFIFVGAGIGALALLTILGPGAAAGADVANRFILPGVFLVLSPAGVWAIALRPRVVLGTTDLLIVNPFGSVRIPLADIAQVSAGYGGLVVNRRSGKSVSAWAVQKANLSRWMGWPARGDRIAEAINKAANPAAGK